MDGKLFLDTNILVCARDTGSKGKQEVASAIVADAFGSGSGRTSRQVLHGAGNKLELLLFADDGTTGSDR